MTRKTKKVRCWLVEWPSALWIPNKWFVTDSEGIAQRYQGFREANLPACKDIRITPGHFVPDEPKRKARRK